MIRLLKYPTCILFFLLLLGHPKLLAQDPGQGFYRDFKRTEGVINLKLPGWLVWLGGGLAYHSVKDPETRAVLQLAQKVRGIRFLYSETAAGIAPEALSGLHHQLERGGYEPLIQIRDEDTQISISGKIKGPTFDRLVVLIRDGEEFVFLQAKSRLKAKHIAQLIRKLRKLDVQVEQKKGRPSPKIPQA